MKNKITRANWIPILVVVIVISLIALFCYGTPILRFDLSIDHQRFASFASLLTAIFSGVGLFYLYSQIEEMKLQRMKAQEPFLFILNSSIDFPRKLTDSRELLKFNIELMNVGKHHAIEISYDWQYSKENIDAFLQERGYTKREGNYLDFVGKIYSDFMYSYANQGNIPLIAADSQKSEKITFPLYLSFYLMEFQAMHKLDEETYEATASKSLIDSIRINFKFKDIEGVQKRKSFAFKTKFRYFENGVDITAVEVNESIS